AHLRDGHPAPCAKRPTADPLNDSYGVIMPWSLLTCDPMFLEGLIYGVPEGIITRPILPRDSISGGWYLTSRSTTWSGMLNRRPILKRSERARAEGAIREKKLKFRISIDRLRIMTIVVDRCVCVVHIHSKAVGMEQSILRTPYTVR